MALITVGFAVLAIELIMRGNGGPTKEDAETAAVVGSASAVVTMDSAAARQAGIEVVTIGRNAAVPLMPNGALRVPEASIQQVDGNWMVFVADTLPSRYVRRFVHVGSRRDGKIEIASGLLPGDELVIKGAALLEAELERVLARSAHITK